MRTVTCCSVLSLCLTTPTFAGGVDLDFVGSFSTSGPLGGGADGIAFHHTRGTLFLLDSSGSTIAEVTTGGVLLNSFVVPGGLFAEGIDVLADGNLVTVDQNTDLVTTFETDGTLLGTVAVATGDFSNGVVDDGAGSLFITDDGDLVAFEQIGGALGTVFDLGALGIDEPEGIEIFEDGIWVCSDSLAALFEITGSDAPFDLLDLTGFGDPEGLAYDDATGTLYVAFDSDQQVGVFTVGTADPCACDFSGNGVIDVDDMLVVLSSWGSPAGDCTGDGLTNVDDLLVVLSSFGPCATQGACCLFDSCFVTTQDDCETQGGVYRGDGTDCAGGTCLGACCTFAGCSDTYRLTCEQDPDGSWQGYDTTCADNPCDIGACCWPDGACFTADEFDCAIITKGTGIWTPGTTCEPNECESTLGACCVEGGCLDGIDEFTCEQEFGGTYLGPGTTCDECP